jgi:alkanesulfonate monooxygenase SsuD/methylene tetrahydromethanopterin reductase-like flavin-dependent oxidoreductase (luciferase family)
MPAGDVVLAAIAASTSRIDLGSAVTVLSSDDPVRVFQRYSTLNAISGGRAEVILGRRVRRLRDSAMRKSPVTGTMPARPAS